MGKGEREGEIQVVADFARYFVYSACNITGCIMCDVCWSDPDAGRCRVSLQEKTEEDETTQYRCYSLPISERMAVSTASASCLTVQSTAALTSLSISQYRDMRFFETRSWRRWTRRVEVESGQKEK